MTPKLGSEAQDKLLRVAKPSYPYPIEHSGTAGHLTMSSLDDIMNEDETLTWVEQHVVTATGRDARRTRNKRWEANREGKPPALMLSTLKSTQEAIKPRRKHDGPANPPPYAGPTSRGHPVAIMQERVDMEKMSETA